MSAEDIWSGQCADPREPAIEGFDAAVKRAMDLAVASLLIIGLSPLMLLTALLIRLDSPGPSLFVQTRVGKNGRLFKIYKFRTMVVDAEDRLSELVNLQTLTEPYFKIPNDPRVTRIGRLLRRSSLDELPQCINVLLGDMSLVGPRPEERQVVERYTRRQRQRLTVKPGITGPMQVNGRGDLSFELRLALELEYIQNYSLRRDLDILARTVPVVLLGIGAR